MLTVRKILAADNLKRNNTKTILYFLLASVFFLFIPFILLLLRNINISSNFRYPAALTISTMVLIGASILLRVSMTAKQKDNYLQFRTLITASLTLGLIFVFIQVHSFIVMYPELKALSSNIISIIILVHAAHFLVAVLLLTKLAISAIRFRSGADLYIFFLDIKNERLLYVTKIFWDYLGYLWIGLYLIMLLKTI